MAQRAPAVDAATIDELEKSVGDDRLFLRELVETYVDDAAAQLAAMRNGLASDDMERLHRAAHTLKSNSASMGAHELGELCRQLEYDAGTALRSEHSVDRESLQSRLDEIGNELERVIDELNALVPAAA